RFNFETVEGRYVRLRIYNGHNTDFNMVQLAEFEVYDTAGRNIAASKEIDRTKDSALIILSNSQRATDAKWRDVAFRWAASSGYQKSCRHH
ncbi:MAG: hypothetical protein ACYS3S_15950, partial [Planctomycetota bacterium]